VTVEPLDGNAIAGALHEAFGIEMTTEQGTCRSCGTASLLAELRVYTRAPGAVARCPACGNVVFVLVDVGGKVRVHLDGLELHGPGAASR
jgi:ribosomal protein S27AE